MKKRKEYLLWFLQCVCRHSPRTGIACLFAVCLRVRMVRNLFRTTCEMHLFLPFTRSAGDLALWKVCCIFVCGRFEDL